MNRSSSVFEVSADNFDTEVLEKSQRVLVVADFWAAWCAPCRVLMPLLQKLAEEYQGQFLLAKIDTDKQQALAERWGIRSLPTVKLFKGGTVVDEFLGVLPESAVRAILDRHLPRPSDALREGARAAMQNGDRAQALASLQKALAADPDHLPVKLDLADLLIGSGDTDAAEKILKQLPFQQREDKPVKTLLARLEFARAASSASPAAELAKRIAANPNDLESRYLLGAALVASGDYAGALEHFFAIMKQDRRFNNDIGRRSLLGVFELLGNDHELTQQYRRKMAPLLY